MSRKKPERDTRPRLSDLKGLRVCVFLPPSAETQVLTKHLERIGCVAQPCWPIPDSLPPDIEVGIITVEPEFRDRVWTLAASVEDLGPPLIAVAGYEDPSTLQLVLELRAAAVIERPVKPFGLLTNLMIAREVWHRRKRSAERVEAAEARHLALSKIALARILLAQRTGIPAEEAHRCLQKTAMDARLSMEAVAERIIGHVERRDELEAALAKLAQ